MTHPGLRLLAAAALLCVSTASWSTTYTITTTEDVFGDDPEAADECSLRDAFEAINTQTDVNGCDAGTGHERVRVEAGETYRLEHGELRVGQREEDVEDIEDRITPVVRFQLQGRSATENAVLVAPRDERAFDVVDGGELVLESMTVRGWGYEPPEAGTEWECPADADQLPVNGGLIRSLGDVNLFEGSQVTGGHAAGNGGGIFLGGGSSLVMQEAMVADNCADGDGGGIYLEEFSTSVQAFRFYIGGNTAGGTGGGIYAGGQASAGVVMESGTIARNSAETGASGMRLGNDHEFLFNNITVASNYGGSTGFSYSGGGNLESLVTNSAFLGNSVENNGDCAGPEDIETAFVVAGEGCPLAETEGTISALRGHAEDARSAQCGNSEDCLPVAGEEIGADFPGYLPHFATGEQDEDALLLDGGSFTDDINYPCVSRDQRDFARTERCDIGALEFQVATGQANFIDGLSFGKDATLDVVRNDLGDTEIDCTNEEVGLSPGQVIPLPGVLDEDWSEGGTCIYLAQTPSRDVQLSVEIDNDGYPRILYEPRKGYDGFDFFDYRVQKEAFAGRTFADRDVSARVSVRARKPALEESENIDDFISPLPVAGLLFGLFAGMLRRHGRHGLIPGIAGILLLLAFPVSAMAVDITVNSLDDHNPLQPEPGTCTLRGAIDSAMDEWQSASYCQNGRKGTNHILINVEGTISLDETASPENQSFLVDSGNNLIIEGQGPKETVIEGNGVSRLFEAYSSIVLRNLTLRGGNADIGGAVLTDRNLSLENVIVEDNSATDGGAIYLGLGESRESSFSARRVHFRDNQATGRGGVIFTAGQDQRHTIEIESSTFESNSAENGGVFYLILPTGSGMDVANSTFYENTAAARASVLMADSRNIGENAGVFIMNSSFLNNRNENGNGGEAFFLHEDENGRGRVSMSNSYYIADSDDNCHGEFDHLQHNLFSSRGIECNARNEENNQWDYDGRLIDLSADGLVRDYGGEGEFVPPFVEIETGDDEIFDAGSVQSLQSGFRSPMACRAEDKRGRTRTAGERCDLGAFQLQVSTAADLDANNRERSDRIVIVRNIFDSAIEGDGDSFQKDSLRVDHVETESGNGTEEELGRACVRPEGSEHIPCKLNDQGIGDEEADDFVIRYEAPSEIVDDDGNNKGYEPFQCAELPRRDLRVPYEFDSEQQSGIAALATIEVGNVPPSTHSGRRSFRIRPGGTLNISLDHVVDPDGADDLMRLMIPENSGINFATSRKKDPDCDEEEEFCEFESLGEGLKLPVACPLNYPERNQLRVLLDDDGDHEKFSCLMPEDEVSPDAEIVDFYVENDGYLIDPENRTLVYKHGSTFQNFRDRFAVSVMDECGDSSSAHYEVTFPDPSRTSDDVISGLYWWQLLALGLAVLARRRAIRCS